MKQIKDKTDSYIVGDMACNDEKIGERLNDKVMKEALYKISATFE